MKRKISLTLEFDLSIGKVNPNEIVYQMKERRDSTILDVLGAILTSYDNLIAEPVEQHPKISQQGEKRAGGRKRKGDEKGRFSRGCIVCLRGCRNTPKRISTTFGKLDLRIRVVECFN